MEKLKKGSGYFDQPRFIITLILPPPELKGCMQDITKIRTKKFCLHQLGAVTSRICQCGMVAIN